MGIKTEEKRREELLKFLDEKLFDAILRASPDDYKSEDLKKKLHDVKKHIEREKHRFHDQNQYPTAEDVKKNVLADLHSKTGRKIDHELDGLKLPCLPKIKDEFLKLCEELSV
ncbi:MAG: hypothetical protein M0033_07700 [Nitrospiraceae bacterium]|nr:hypothetical protein [Nitrospiraceae bacterium]